MTLRVYGVEETEEGTWLVTDQTTETILAEEDTMPEAARWLAENADTVLPGYAS